MVVNNLRNNHDLPKSVIIRNGQLHHTMPIVVFNFQNQFNEQLTLNDFHEFLLELIIGKLDCEGLCSLSQTSRRFNVLCNREEVWEDLVVSTFGHRQNRVVERSESDDDDDEQNRRFILERFISWKTVYKMHKEVLFALFRGTSNGRVQSNNQEWFVNHANELTFLPLPMS